MKWSNHIPTRLFRHINLAVCAGIFLLGCLVGCANNTSHTELPFDAIVDVNDVNAFHSIRDALDAAPQHSTQPFTIFIAPGSYYEKLIVDKPNIIFQGSGQDKTRIYFDAYSGQTKPNSNEHWSTSGSGSVIIRAADFTARDLTIANSFAYPANDRLPDDHPDKIRGSQAVALMTDTGSDRALFERVTVTGYQDTLYTKAGRSLFRNSTISGHVDFIFGGGTAVFWQSDIITRARPDKTPPIGYITAPSTQISSPYGLVFIDCRLTREADVADASMALGRPWHPTTTFADGRYADPNALGQTVFINTWMDAHILDQAWWPMSGNLPDGSRADFQPEDARFFEYQSHGPGARNSSNRRHLNKSTAAQFSRENILQGWWPAAAP